MKGFTRAQLRTLFVVWITYATFYVCRVNVGPARTEIQAGLALDPLEIGIVFGALKIGYALGQLVNGQLTERYGAKKILLLGMIGSACASLLFATAAPIASALDGTLPAFARGVGAIAHVFSPKTALGPVAALLTVVWFANGYFQSGGWPPTVKTMSRWFTPVQRGRMMGVIGTSYQLGSALTIVVAGALVSLTNDWRSAFWVPAFVMLVAASHAYLRLREHPGKDADGADEAPGVVPETAAEAKAPLLETLRLTLTNGKIWVLATGLFGLDLVRYGFLDWAPGQLKTLHGSTAAAALKVAVFPLAGAVGALVSGWATDRWFQSRRAPVIVIWLVLCSAFTFLFDFVAAGGVAPTVACLAGAGFFLYGAQILLVGTAAQDFAKKGRAAAAAGFVDAMGGAGSFAGDIATGWFLKNRDFHAAIHFWGAAALVAALVASTLWNARPPAKTA